MKQVPDVTLIIGIDASSYQALMTTIPTWRKNRPELWDWPWLVFFDPTQIIVDESLKNSINPNARYMAWNGNGEYGSQREKMLTGHFYAGAEVETEWGFKLDCDAIALNPPAKGWPKWPVAEWFHADEDGQKNALTGNSWGYSRSIPDRQDILNWCEKLEQFGDYLFPDKPRLNLSDHITSWEHRKGPRVRMTRFVSWCAFQQTEFIRFVAKECSKFIGEGHLPVGSHDSVAWYSAARGGYKIQYVKMARYGFTNRATNTGRRNEVAKVMQCS